MPEDLIRASCHQETGTWTNFSNFLRIDFTDNKLLPWAAGTDIFSQ